MGKHFLQANYLTDFLRPGVGMKIKIKFVFTGVFLHENSFSYAIKFGSMVNEFAMHNFADQYFLRHCSKRCY